MRYNAIEGGIIMYKAGDVCYFLESSRNIIEGTIRSCAGGKYVVKYGDGKGIRLPVGRLYRTLEEAQAALPKREPVRRYRSPYDYM